MFEEAIQTAARFTRAIHTLRRSYKSEVIQPGAATLFFVNADGWALTCKHVAQLLQAAEQLGQKRRTFKAELSAGLGQGKKKAWVRELERKYGLSKKTIFEAYSRFFNCFQGEGDIGIEVHQELDVALLQFQKFPRLLCSSFPVFASDVGPKPGKFLCRLGFPFPEFTNYDYDRDADEIRWTKTGREDTPRFPIEGMVTRRIRHTAVKFMGFELSTPGLRGQSGGPAFDAEGVVWGMQFGTAHLDLDFDVSQEVFRDGKKKPVSSHSFLHVGGCVTVGVLKEFMKEHGVRFEEAKE